MSLADAANGDGTYTLTWSSSGATFCAGAAGWPTSDVLTPSGFVTTPVLTATTSYSLVCNGANGNAVASVTITIASSSPPPGNSPPITCTPPQVLIGGTCQIPPPIGALTLVINPTTVADSSQGCPPPDPAQSCVANINGTLSNSTEALCYDSQGGNIGLNGVSGYGVGPYPAAQDGATVLNVTCISVYNQQTSASITLAIVPPLPNPVADTWTEVNNGNGTYTFTWSTTSAQGAGGCNVQLVSSPGIATTLIPGGNPSGSATSGALSPAGDPYAATLICSGVPDTGLPTFTVNF